MPYDLKTTEDILRAIKDDRIRTTDLRFTDLRGHWQHLSVPSSAFDLDVLVRGIAFHGSSIRQRQKVRESDMLAIPDPASAFLDPFAEVPTLVLICNLRDPATGQNYSRDPRHIAQKAEAYLRMAQIGDTANFGLKLEPFVVDGVRNHPSINPDDREAATVEAGWSAMRRVVPGQGQVLRPDEGHGPVPPDDVLQEIRTRVVATLWKIGIEVEAHRREGAPSGRAEINMRFATLTRMADNLMICKYVVENVARRRGMTALFPPNSPSGSDDSSLHVHQSIWQGEQPLFAGHGYAGSSALMRHYLAGLLEHAPALFAICAPAADPYGRPMPGFDAPVGLGYGQRDRSAACRIPAYSPSPNAKRVEFRCPDPSCNPYLAFAAMLMAGIDGFYNRLYSLDPSEPIENFFDLPPQTEIPSALGSFETEHSFLLKGDVFTSDMFRSDLIGTRPSSKRAR